MIHLEYLAQLVLSTDTKEPVKFNATQRGGPSRHEVFRLVWRLMSCFLHQEGFVCLALLHDVVCDEVH